MNRLLSYISCCFLLSSSLFFMSCKEEDDTVEEFPNWQAQNDAYFSQIWDEAQAKIAAGDATWDCIVSYSKPTTDYSYKRHDYIVVQKLESGTATASPLLTDTVQVHYVGQLKESASKYKEHGMVFDRTYVGEFDASVATPATLSVSGTVNGFATALMHMHKGDHWRVYIPYQLGYGSTAYGSIPGGSTLIFDLRLTNFWRKK